MGVVYRGRHRHLDRQVAIKVCMPDAQITRFQREAKILAAVRSPHVVPVHDFDLLPDGRALLVMDWIAGQDLGKLLRGCSGPMPETRVLPWMEQVCQGMQTAADEGIVHRDLKPSNILIDEKNQAHVADFGLARSIQAGQLTFCGGIMGTPHYMAPEQAEDPRCADTRADIYSFGATFYHVLTGKPPFDGDTAFSVLFKHKTEPLIAPKARNPSLSKPLNDFLERCLAKAPQERFATFRDVARHLMPSEQNSPWDAPDDSDLTHLLKVFRSRRGIYLEGDPKALPEPDFYPLSDERVISIGFGNLVDQKVDAVVSSDDEMLSMGGGVSGQLLWSAGAVLAEEARRFVPVRPGRAVVTTAGRLPVRFVLHGVVMGSLKDEWVNPSRDLLNEIMESCFYHADTLGLRSLAFPLLGTGAGRFPKDLCLDTMFRFLARKLTRGLTTVQFVQLILYDPSTRVYQRPTPAEEASKGGPSDEGPNTGTSQQHQHREPHRHWWQFWK
jgi:serine/threonine protein kinase